MKSGAQIIVQAALQEGHWGGRDRRAASRRNAERAWGLVLRSDRHEARARDQGRHRASALPLRRPGRSRCKETTGIRLCRAPGTDYDAAELSHGRLCRVLPACQREPRNGAVRSEAGRQCPIPSLGSIATSAAGGTHCDTEAQERRPSVAGRGYLQTAHRELKRHAVTTVGDLAAMPLPLTMEAGSRRPPKLREGARAGAHPDRRRDSGRRPP